MKSNLCEQPIEIVICDTACLKSMKSNLSEQPIDIMICDTAGLKCLKSMKGNRSGQPIDTVCLKSMKGNLSEQPIDIVICDTAGRLHTAYALMEELEGCKAAISKAMGKQQPDETLLVLDGTTGLNMLNQAKEFNDSVSVVDQLGIPVKFIGVGETVEDLQPFDAANFAEALFPKLGLEGK
eukprot:gene15652-21759_t